MVSSIRSLIRFELQIWLRSPFTYVCLITPFIMGMLAMGGQAGLLGEGSTDIEIANSARQISRLAGSLLMLNYFLIPIFAGSSISRDYGSGFFHVLFSYPITKNEYLSSRLLVSLALSGLSLIALYTGLIAGTHLPGIDESRLLDFQLSQYWDSFLIISLPNIILLHFFIFSVSMASKTFQNGIIAIISILLLRFGIGQISLGIHSSSLDILSDPLAASFTDTLYDASVESHSGTRSQFWTLLLLNRFLWLSLSGCMLMIGWIRFQPSNTSRPKLVLGRRARNQGNFATAKHKLLGKFFQTQIAMEMGRFLRLSTFCTAQLFRSYSFWIAALSGQVVLVILMLNINQPLNTNPLPVTWSILGVPMLIYNFFIIGMTLVYSGVIVHQSKGVGFNELEVSSPLGNIKYALIRLFAVVQMQLLLLFSFMFVGVCVQLFKGVHHIQFEHYLFDLLVVHFVTHLNWAIAAVLIHSLFNRFSVSIFVLLLCYGTLSVLPEIGISSPLLRFNETPNSSFFVKYSDLTGHSYALNSYLIYKGYWLLLSVVMIWLIVAIFPRENVGSFQERFQLFGSKFSMIGFGVTAITWVAFSLVLHNFESRDKEGFEKGGETKFLEKLNEELSAYASFKVPKIQHIDFELELYPNKQAFELEGRYLLRNTSSDSIPYIVVRKPYDEITVLRPSISHAKVYDNKHAKVEVWHLEKALLAGDTISVSFHVRSDRNTWLKQNSPVRKKATYLKTDIFPRFGNSFELEAERPEYGVRFEQNYQSLDSDELTFQASIGTSADQQIVAPGILISKNLEEGRATWHYKSAGPTKFSFAILSGDYVKKSFEWSSFQLDIYHHASHRWAISNISSGIEASLNFHNRNFSPSELSHFVVAEFSRSEGSFATLSHNLLPISETRFINRISEVGPGDVDLSFYVAAHEISHHWWGNQIKPARALGAGMLTESLAEYASACIYEEQYGRDALKSFLGIQMQRYREGRNKQEATPALAFATLDDTYLTYGKGAVVFYFLSNELGRKNFNKTLSSFLEKFAEKKGQYPSSLDLMEHLIESFPNSKETIKRLIGEDDHAFFESCFEQILSDYTHTNHHQASS